MKYSKQREMIYKTVQNLKTHPTADEIYTALKIDNPNISLGTVYRNLNLLSQKDKIKKIRISEGSDRYDFCLTPHYHLLCEDCGKVFDVEIPELKNIEERIFNTSGYQVNELNLTIKGYCADCGKFQEKVEA